MGESGDKLGASVEDDLVVKAEFGEDVVEKDVGDVSGRGSLVARLENYSL